jgi:hypothetical protein
MTAHAHPSTIRSRPTPRRASRVRRAAGSGEPRLPWWGLALPVLVFCILLALMLAGGDAEAAQRGSEPLARLLERLQQIFL